MSNNKTTSEEREPVRGDATNEEFFDGQSACLSNTQTNNSQVSPSNHSFPDSSSLILSNEHRNNSDDDSLLAFAQHVLQPSVNIDWLEGSMCLHWTEQFSNEFVTNYNELQLRAREHGDCFPVNLAGYPGLIHASGMGAGRQTRMTYRFTLNQMTLGLAFREKTNRHLPNFYFKIPGEACLKQGAEQCLAVIRELIDFWGGAVLDDWVRRLDIAADFPGLDIQDWLIPAIEQKHFLTTARYWDTPDGVDGKRSIIVGNRDRVRLVIYDKLLEARKKSDEIGFQALVNRRWWGQIPEAATRVEFQITRTWLKQYGLERIDQVVQSLPDILVKMTEAARGRFFAITDREPDREQNHQSRAELDSRWSDLVEQMITTAGQPREKLMPIERGSFRQKRAWGVIKGYITSVAANLGQRCESMQDAIHIIRYLGMLNENTDQDWKTAWDLKCRKLGVVDFVSPDHMGDVPF